MQIVDDRNAGQELRIVGLQIREQGIDEVRVQRAAAARDRVDRGLGVRATADRRKCELQTQRPALGQLMQAGAGIGVDAAAKPAARQSDSLLELEAQ